MELLDKVDVNDNVIGTTDKVEAHTNGYAHRVAAVFVFTPDNTLLVQLRKKDGLLDHSVGGHIRQGETYEQGAVRESDEELGITKKLESVGIFYANEIVPRGKLKVVHYFGLYKVLLTNEEVEHIVISKDEVEKLIPMKLEDIVRGMKSHPEKYTTGFMSTINYYIRKYSLPLPMVEPR